MPPPEEYNEKQLLSQIAGGDTQAFETLYNRYWEKIHAFVFRLTESSQASEDVVQDVFIKIWQQRDRLTDIENMNAWLYMIARNHTINSLKKLAKAEIVANNWGGQQLSEDTPEGIQLKKAMGRLLDQAIDQLPPQQKLIYELSRTQRLRYDEIGGKLHISPLTVKKHMAQALQFIRQHTGCPYESR